MLPHGLQTLGGGRAPFRTLTLAQFKQTGRRTHHNLRSDGRPIRSADVGEIAKQIKMLAG